MRLGRIISGGSDIEGLRNGNIVEILETGPPGSRALISTLSAAFPETGIHPFRMMIAQSQITIFLYGPNFSFDRELINQNGGIRNITSNGNEISVNIALRTFDLNSIRNIRAEDYRHFLVNPNLVGTRNENKVSESVNNNLKVVFSSNEKLNSTELLRIFKYVPVIISGCPGWYDPSNKRVVAKIKEVTKNPIRPWVVDSSKYKIKFWSLDSLGITEQEIWKIFHHASLRTCKFKVKDYVESGKIFKFTNEKKEALNKEFEALDITIGFESKNSDKQLDTIILKLPTGNRRFVLSDVEIIYPNIKGYSETKDRTIKAGSKIRVVDDKHTIFKRNDIVVPTAIKKIGSKNYALFEVSSGVKAYNINKFKTI